MFKFVRYLSIVSLLLMSVVAVLAVQSDAAQQGVWWASAYALFGLALSVVLVQLGQIILLLQVQKQRHVYDAQQLSHMAYFDELTGLPNRTLFYDRLSHAMLDAERHEYLVAVMYLDLDRFKGINDSLGHEAGDDLLRQAAERLKQCVRASDTVARVGGDEFTLVLTELQHINNASSMAHKILNSIDKPFLIDGKQLYVTASIGVTIYPFDDNDVDKLIKNADTAMYSAKKAGRNNYQFYSAQMTAQARQRLALENSLRDALEHDELEMFYQPQVDIKSDKIIGVAAMLRWRHPDKGLIGPEQFMSVAEDSGLMVPLGKWVLRTVCDQFSRLRNKGHEDLPIAISLSSRQLKESEVIQALSEGLRMTECDPQLFRLEITESLLMETDRESVTCIKDLTSLGVKLSIDDFGIGYSPLYHLKRFNIDSVKVDRSFIQELNTDPDYAAITKAIITMAHSLDIKVVAMDVQTVEQFQFLQQQGCDIMQGSYYSPPLSMMEFARLLQQTETGPRKSAESPS